MEYNDKVLKWWISKAKLRQLMEIYDFFPLENFPLQQDFKPPQTENCSRTYLFLNGGCNI